MSDRCDRCDLRGMISVICIEGIRNEILRMTEMAKENIHDSFDVFMHGDIKKYEKVENREEYVDFLNKEISRYITNAITHEATKAGSQIFNSFYTITSNIERISDHAINIAGYSKMIEEKNISFSDNANTEIDEIKDICDKTMDMLLQKPDNIIKWHENVICMEQKIDDMISSNNNVFDEIKNLNKKMNHMSSRINSINNEIKEKNSIFDFIIRIIKKTFSKL